jgi:hypothetical protein
MAIVDSFGQGTRNCFVASDNLAPESFGLTANTQLVRISSGWKDYHQVSERN